MGQWQKFGNANVYIDDNGVGYTENDPRLGQAMAQDSARKNSNPTQGVNQQTAEPGTAGAHSVIAGAAPTPKDYHDIIFGGARSSEDAADAKNMARYMRDQGGQADWSRVGADRNEGEWSRSFQLQGLGALQDAANGGAPSAAAAQQGLGLNQAMQQGMGQAASSRTAGGMALAQRAGMAGYAQGGGAAMAQAGQARGLEAAQARGAYMDATNAFRGNEANASRMAFDASYGDAALRAQSQNAGAKLFNAQLGTEAALKAKAVGAQSEREMMLRQIEQGERADRIKRDQTMANYGVSSAEGLAGAYDMYSRGKDK